MVMPFLPSVPDAPDHDEKAYWVFICLFGQIRLFKQGQPVALRTNGKMEALLCHLALGAEHRVPRDSLLCALWPEHDPSLACQSLHSLVHSLHKLLGGVAPVIHNEGHYQLNSAAGVQVDIDCFERWITQGERVAQTHGADKANLCYERAVRLYHGDLCTDHAVQAVIERERLRARYLNLLSRLANSHYQLSNDEACLHFALRLLSYDACREDAHRLVMRCYAKRGERTQALRQYRLCEQQLQAEFGAVPEAATRALFDQLRLDPSSV